MPSFRSSGGLDDQILTDGDVGFVGMNQRFQPNQLGAGEVVLSRNGRIDGYWQPRTGIVLRSGALSNSAFPLRVPFYLIDTPLTVTNVYIPETIEVSGSLTFFGNPLVYKDFERRGSLYGRPSYGADGQSMYWNSFSNIWFMDFQSQGYWYSFDNVATPDLVTTWVPGPDNTGNPVLTFVAGSGVAQLYIVGHGLPIGSSGWAEIKNLDADVNGVKLLTWAGVDSLNVEVPGLTSITDTSGTLEAAVIDDEAVSNIYGSCIFSDPENTLDESAILATNLDAKKVLLKDYTVTSIPYPAGAVVTGRVELLQAFDKVFLFRDGQRAWEWIPQGKPITAGTYVSTTGVVTLTVRDHGLTTGDEVTISDVGFSPSAPTADPNGTFTVASTPTVDTFTYTIPTGSGDETYTANTGKMVATGFTKVPGGPYTQPQTFIVASNAAGFSVTDGLVSLPVTSNTTIQAGNFVTIYETTIPEFSSVVGKSFQVTSATSTLIQFFAPIGNFTAGGSDQIEVGGQFSIGGGFIHMPAPPWAVYFQRRLWAPYWYEPNGTTASPVYLDRMRRDEIVASDILDSHTFDQIFSQFRITGGIADYIVGMHPFYNDNLLVFNRNSIHLIRGTQGTLADTVVTELTREVGCLARKSIASKGNAVFFLSDSGVYAIEFIDEYNLRGAEEPLSKNIQPIIDRINQGLAEQAVGIYFNNRYWLALPLDSVAGANDATGNNSVVVFNMLNKAWESLDDYNVADFDIIGFHIGQEEERNSLYIVNSFGGIHEVDANESPVDIYSTNTLGGSSEAGVQYELVSRGYMLGQGNFERKKFMRAQVQVQSGDQSSDLDFYFSSEDPDTDKFRVTSIGDMIDQNLPSQESGNFRFRLGNPRGLYGTLTISAVSVGSNPVGRPKINSITLDGAVTNRQTISQF